jgi:GT2 family glycosyltransferase
LEAVSTREFVVLSNLELVGDASEKIGALSPIEYLFDVPSKINYAGGALRLIGRDVNGNGQIDKGQFDKVMETQLLSGPAMMFKVKALRDVGLFDENFFYGSEDKDIAFRFICKGFKIAFVPRAKIWHKRRGATGGKIGPLNVYFHVRNSLLYVRKNFSRVDICVFSLYFLIIDFPFTLLRSFYNRKSIKYAMLGLIWHLSPKIPPSNSELAKKLLTKSYV